MMRSKGIGGATAEQMSRYHANRGPAAKAAMADKADQDMLDRMGEEYDKRMPVLEPRVMPGKRFAKGGSIDGCAQRGKTKGRMV